MEVRDGPPRVNEGQEAAEKAEGHRVETTQDRAATAFFGGNVDAELEHWQRVEAEAWGAELPDLPSVVKPDPAKTPSNRGVAFVALLVLAALAGLWSYTREAPATADGAVGKVVESPAVARRLDQPCQILSELRASQADAYIRLLGQEDPDIRAQVLGASSRNEVRIFDRLVAVAPGLSASVAPMRSRAQLIADGMPAVARGEQTLEGLLATTAVLGPEIARGDLAVDGFETRRCSPTAG